MWISDSHEATEFSMEKLRGLIAKLRGEEGCPWDRKQTLETMAKYLEDEAKEAIEEILKGDAEALCEELGDVLLIVLMLSRIAEESGKFSFDDVVKAISVKIVRRHPHVFGGETVEDTQQVIDNWHRIKREEKAERAARGSSR